MSADGWFAYGGSTALSRITTNFIHDMSTGTWFACLIVMWTIDSQSQGVPAEAAAVLSAANRNVFWLLLASLVGLTVTGILRLFYWRRETAPDLVRQKRRALIFKHIAFLLVYGMGTLWAATLAF